nr:replication protein P [Cedecea davisae]
MTGIYSDKWKAKNGRAPSLRWNQVISALTDQQLQSAVDACVQRCCAGNQFAPDLAEFMGIVSSDVTNPFGLKVEEVITEWRRYCRTRHQYSCPETFNWKHPVLYHICCTLRSEMIQRNLNDIEIEKRASVHIKAWSDKVRAGGKVPEPKPLLSEKPTGRRTHDGGTGRAEVLAILEKLRHTNRK